MDEDEKKTAFKRILDMKNMGVPDVPIPEEAKKDFDSMFRKQEPLERDPRLGSAPVGDEYMRLLNEISSYGDFRYITLDPEEAISFLSENRQNDDGFLGFLVGLFTTEALRLNFSVEEFNTFLAIIKTAYAEMSEMKE